MAKMKVCKSFTDNFNGHYYVAGEAYPGKYGSAAKERLDELKKNKYIEEEVDNSKELEAENAELKAEIEKLKAELEAKKETKPAKEKK
ncbi:hypothetical protein [Desemzia sp. FAM 23989]|uniref:hypothetical protein n=1 Tax=Desemzia sp. FAM 23989 TaxID=3259523 RepID=UPI00388A0A69